MQLFTELLKTPWTEAFHDSGMGDWKENWFLDGENAMLKNTSRGLEFFAGPKTLDDAHHAVLWTQKEFKGDLKIEYEYTRLDNEIRMVTILYIQATGSGEPGFDKDIRTWSNARKVPSMRHYFKHMHTYHVSYAAFGMKNTIPGDDYIRARRYMCSDLRGTELDNEYINTGLFEPDVPHQITIIKRNFEIYMHIKNPEKDLLCHFINSKFPPIIEGRVGFRHMFTRSARYRNFKVSVNK
ncbi:MAG: hypothetical protein AAF558_02170 [Verrucomicrobiota bacterium]